MDDGRSWGKVAARLAPRFRVVRLHRRQYRLDIATGSPWTIAQEVDDVLAVAKVIGEPMLVVGHSSGGWSRWRPWSRRRRRFRARSSTSRRRDRPAAGR
jgi:pimeloyl-ACP methyl ester carboxylesterase